MSVARRRKAAGCTGARRCMPSSLLLCVSAVCLPEHVTYRSDYFSEALAPRPARESSMRL